MNSLRRLPAVFLFAALLLFSTFSADASTGAQNHINNPLIQNGSEIIDNDLNHYSIYGMHIHKNNTAPYLFLTFIFIMTIVTLMKWRFDSLKQKNNELKQAKDELERTKAMFTAFTEATSDVIIFCSPDRKEVSFISRAYSRLTGKDTDTFINRPLSFRECVHPEDLRLFKRNSLSLLQGKESEKFRVINQQTSAVHWVMMRSYSFCSVSGEKTEISAIVISDITELALSQEEKSLKDSLIAQKAKYASMGEMIRAISHQWKQPLNALYLCNQLLHDENNRLKDKILGEYLETSKELVEHMIATMQDFRHFFKKDNGVSYFDATETVLSTMRIIDPQMKDLKIKYKVACICSQNRFEARNEPSGKSHTCRFAVKGLSNEFRHAVINILQNAKDELMKADMDEKRIDVSMSCNGSFTLCISDTGAGIGTEKLDDIFDPHFTLKQEGTGLGLHLTRQIVEKMDGRVWAESSPKGAKFFIDLPIQEASLS